MSEKDMSEKISSSFKSLSHPIRVQILLILAGNLNNGYNFGDISRELRIESSGKLSFHLEKLKELVTQDEDGRYLLTEMGKNAVEAIRHLGISGNDDIELTDTKPVQVVKSNSSTKEDETDSKFRFGYITVSGIFSFLLPLIFLSVIHNVIDASWIGNNPVPVLTDYSYYWLYAGIGTLVSGYTIGKQISADNSEIAYHSSMLVIVIVGTLILMIGGFLPINATDKYLHPVIPLSITFLVIILGFYLGVQTQPNSRWDNSYLFPEYLSLNKIAILLFLLINIAAIPVWKITIYPFDKGDFAHSSDLPDHGYAPVTLTSYVFSMTGYLGIFLGFVVLGLSTLSTKMKELINKKQMYILMFALIFVFHLILNVFPSKYENAFVVDKKQANLWIIFDLISSTFAFFGTIIAVTIFRSYLNSISKINSIS